MSLPLEEELDRLYQRPLEEFVAARNALAKALKLEGDAERSKEVKALAKPSVSAWAVNQLFFRARDVFDRILEAGDACRRAQSDLLGGGEPEALAEAERERDDALEKARRRIRFILSDARAASGPAVLGRVSTTLEALASFGSANPTPWNGRRSEDLEAPGFRALSGLPAPRPAVSPRPPAAQTPRAEEPGNDRAQREWKARLLAAERELEKARGTLAAAEAAREGARRELAELRDRVAAATSKLDAAESNAVRAGARVEEKRADLEALRKKSGGDGAS